MLFWLLTSALRPKELYQRLHLIVPFNYNYSYS